MVIREGTTSSGVKFKIDDAMMAPCGSEKARILAKAQREVAHQIIVNYAEKQLKGAVQCVAR